MRPSPVTLIPASGTHPALWLKRDDLNAPRLGGNKVRALEFLLGRVQPGDTVVTVGGTGSTHVLATTLHAAHLGARVSAYRWPHELTPLARQVAAHAAAQADHIVATHNPLSAILHGRLAARHARSHYIPAGGSTPLGALGHVNAALELAAQISAGDLPRPHEIILPLGSGGSTAGLLVGLAIADLPVTVVGARVTPRLAVTRGRVMRLARATATLIARVTGRPVPALDPSRLVIDASAYGGAYGRPLPAADSLVAALRHTLGVQLDPTYSAKAYTVALARACHAPGPVLFWLTFDARAVV